MHLYPRPHRRRSLSRPYTSRTRGRRTRSATRLGSAGRATTGSAWGSAARASPKKTLMNSRGVLSSDSGSIRRPWINGCPTLSRRTASSTLLISITTTPSQRRSLYRPISPIAELSLPPAAPTPYYAPVNFLIPIPITPLTIIISIILRLYLGLHLSSFLRNQVFKKTIFVLQFDCCCVWNNGCRGKSTGGEDKVEAMGTSGCVFCAAIFSFMINCRRWMIIVIKIKGRRTTFNEE